MRRIIRQREIVVDDVRYPGEPEQVGARYVPTLAELLSGGTPDVAVADAVLLGPTDELEPLAPHLPRLKLIVVDFPKVGEGRGFSQARVLRQRYHFNGELRARGALKRDQLFFLARSGFNAFDLDPAEDLQGSLAAFDTFKVAYQDGNEDVVHVQRRQPA